MKSLHTWQWEAQAEPNLASTSKMAPVPSRKILRVRRKIFLTSPSARRCVAMAGSRKPAGMSAIQILIASLVFVTVLAVIWLLMLDPPAKKARNSTQSSIRGFFSGSRPNSVAAADPAPDLERQSDAAADPPADDNKTKVKAVACPCFARVTLLS